MLGHGCVAVKILSATLIEQFDYPIEKMQSNIVAIKVGDCVAPLHGELVVSFKDPVTSIIWNYHFFLKSGIEILELRAMIWVAEHHIRMLLMFLISSFEAPTVLYSSRRKCELRYIVG